MQQRRSLRSTLDSNPRLSTPTCSDLLDGDGDQADLVLAGDVFYSKPMAARILPFLQRAAARGARVLVGDPGRAFLPTHQLRTIVTYQVPTGNTFADAEISQSDVLELSPLTQPTAPR
jgi:predicted nicotinamide N-methyase